MHKILEREKVNPAEEFKNDSMMRELHEGMKKRYEETKHMSVAEKIKRIKEEALEFREGK